MNRQAEAAAPVRHRPWHVARRMVGGASALLPLIVGTLLMGMAIYHYVEHLNWSDAFLNSSMLLGGMGPVNPPQTNAGKLFAGCYALYAGLVFIVTAAVMFTPVLHRLMHLFHWNDKA